MAAFDAKLLQTLATDEVLRTDVRLLHTTYALVRTLKGAGVAALFKTAGLSASDFARALLVHSFLLKYLPVDARALVWEAAEQARSASASAQGVPYAGLLRALHEQLLIVNSATRPLGSASAQAPPAELLDYFDGRLLAFVLHTARDQSIKTLGWSASMEKALLGVWRALIAAAAGADVTDKFLPFFQIKTIAAPDVQDVDEVELVQKAKEKYAAHVPTLPGTTTQIATTGANAAGASSSSSSTLAASAEETPDNWDDADAPAAKKAEAKKAEPVEEDAGSWEDLADEPEPAKPEPVKVEADEAAVADGAPVASVDASLTPIIALDNKFVSDVSGALDAKLSREGLEAKDASAEGTASGSVAHPLNAYAARFAAGPDTHLDDGMEEEEKTSAPKDRREQKQQAKMVNYWQQYSKSLVGGRLVLREVVMAASLDKKGDKDKEEAADGDEEEEDEEEEKKSASAGKGAKGGKADKADKPKKAGKPGAGGGKGGAKKGAKGGKGGKEGELTREEQIRAQVREQQRQKDVKKIMGKVNIASSMSTLAGRIAKLDSELEQMGDATAVPAMLTLLDWCMELWKVSKPKSEIEPAIKVFVLIHDIYRRFRQFLTDVELKKILTAMVQTWL